MKVTSDPGDPSRSFREPDLPQATWPLEGWSRSHIDGFHPHPLQAVRVPPQLAHLLLDPELFSWQEGGSLQASAPRGHLRLLVWVWAHWVLSTCAEMKTRASGSSPPRAGVPSFLQPPWQSLSQQRTLALPPGHRGLREKLLRGFHRPAALAQGPGRAGWLRELGHLERA